MKQRGFFDLKVLSQKRKYNHTSYL